MVNGFIILQLIALVTMSNLLLYLDDGPCNINIARKSTLPVTYTSAQNTTWQSDLAPYIQKVQDFLNVQLVQYQQLMLRHFTIIPNVKTPNK